jgi:hypothetical protein
MPEARVLRIGSLSLLLLVVAGCESGRTHAPVRSPDGSMTLHTWVERSRADPVAYLCVVFEIRDREKRVIHTENTRASDRMRWKLFWISNDRIRLESSDIGTYEWRRRADGTWAKDLHK